LLEVSQQLIFVRISLSSTALCFKGAEISLRVQISNAMNFLVDSNFKPVVLHGPQKETSSLNAVPTSPSSITPKSPLSIQTDKNVPDSETSALICQPSANLPAPQFSFASGSTVHDALSSLNNQKVALAAHAMATMNELPANPNCSSTRSSTEIYNQKTNACNSLLTNFVVDTVPARETSMPITSSGDSYPSSTPSNVTTPSHPFAVGSREITDPNHPQPNGLSATSNSPSDQPPHQTSALSSSSFSSASKEITTGNGNAIPLQQRTLPTNNTVFLPSTILPASNFGINMTYVDITPFLNMPQKEVARRLQIPPSTLSKRWKEVARGRKWPYRTVCKLDKEIMALLHNMPPGYNTDKHTQLPEEIETTLGHLLRRRQEELQPVVIRL
jgi:hypothetical protein